MIEHLEEAGAEPDLFSVDGFVAAQMIVQAVREGGDDVEGMIDALEGWTFESVKGEVTVREEDHALIQPMFQVSLVEGDAGWEPELVETIDAETVAPPVVDGK
jgi:branched-chain amino acid transport system substrate-binding protein